MAMGPFRSVLNRRPRPCELRRYVQLMDERGWAEQDARRDLGGRSDYRRNPADSSLDLGAIITRAFEDILRRRGAWAHALLDFRFVRGYPYRFCRAQQSSSGDPIDMSKLTGKALVAQGGGPTAVINQSLVGVVLEARKFPEITKIYGARHGVRGIINEDFLDLTQATTHNLEQVARTPASALGSTRDKPDHDYCRRMFRVMLAHEIRYFFYIGGNDSSDTCRIVNEQAKEHRYELRTIHVPKTIDNDLVGTDHCPGFGSAAKFVAHAFAGANLDNRALPASTSPSSWADTPASSRPRRSSRKKFPDDGPHLIYLPERSFDVDRFAADVEAVYKEHGRCVVAVSEGVCGADGTPHHRHSRPGRCGERRARQHPALGHGCPWRPSRGCSQGQDRHQARTLRHPGVPPALLPRHASARPMPMKRGRWGRRRCSSPSGTTSTARWPSSVSVTTLFSTSSSS